MAFLDMTAELTGTLPGLSPILAQTYVNRALQKIYGERLWSFLLTDGVINCPAQVTAGSISITQYIADVTLDATASAAILAQTLVGATPGILQLQIRFGGPSPTAGPVYSILAFDATNPAAIILTLDHPVQESTNAATSYQIYRCYVIPPIDDFMRWETIVDPANAITMTRQRLTRSSAEFDVMDPQRSSQGLAYNLGSWGGNRTVDPITGLTAPNATVDAGAPIYEFWPHPTTGQNFFCRMRRRGEALVQPQDTQPVLISDALIIQCVLYAYAYPFAMANLANFPQFKNANWLALIMTARQEYSKELLDAKRNDNDTQLQDIWNRGHGLRTAIPFGRYAEGPYPIDAAFLQSHLVRF